MAKQLSGVLKMYIAAGKAAPSPPLGPALGQVKLFPSTYPRLQSLGMRGERNNFLLKSRPRIFANLD